MASLTLLCIEKGIFSINYLFKMQYLDLTKISPKGVFIWWPLKQLLRPKRNLKGSGHTHRLRITLPGKDKTAYKFTSRGQIEHLLFVKISFLFHLHLNTLSNKIPSDTQESIWKDEKNYRKRIRKIMLSKNFKIMWMAGATKICLTWIDKFPQSLPSTEFMMNLDVTYRDDIFDTRDPSNTIHVSVSII